jgi:hypothetical protein
MTEPLEEFIAIRVSKTDRALLDKISHQDGDAPISALVRGWVRKEARERGLTITAETTDAEPVTPV